MWHPKKILRAQKKKLQLSNEKPRLIKPSRDDFFPNYHRGYPINETIYVFFQSQFYQRSRGMQITFIM